MGPYDGIVSASVDRVGRNVRDTLNTQALLTGQDRIVITADHTGVWDFTQDGSTSPGGRLHFQWTGKGNSSLV
jgi:hypothetical protein